MQLRAKLWRTLKIKMQDLNINDTAVSKSAINKNGLLLMQCASIISGTQVIRVLLFCVVEYKIRLSKSVMQRSLEFRAKELDWSPALPLNTFVFLVVIMCFILSSIK